MTLNPNGPLHIDVGPIETGGHFDHHYDRMPHEDSGPHVDEAHGDSPHGDEGHNDDYSDEGHDDVYTDHADGHYDGHMDDPHYDRGHDDEHYDSFGDVHGDHGHDDQGHSDEGHDDEPHNDYFWDDHDDHEDDDSRRPYGDMWKRLEILIANIEREYTSFDQRILILVNRSISEVSGQVDDAVKTLDARLELLEARPAPRISRGMLIAIIVVGLIAVAVALYFGLRETGPDLTRGNGAGPFDGTPAIRWNL